MRSSLPSPFLPAVSLVLLSAVAQALVVTLPTALSDWDITGSSPIYVQWALYPLTFPAPASQFFDIYIRNGVGGMYAPSLNLSIAESVDASTATYYEVPASEAVKFVVGTGYQLFFSDPNDASIVYCDSEVFSIGLNPPPVNSSSSSNPSTETLASSSSSIDSRSSIDPTSTIDSLSASSTDPPSSTELSSPTASPSSTSSDEENRIVAATVPGGAAQQGQNLLFSAGSRFSLGGASIAAAVVAAGLLLPSCLLRLTIILLLEHIVISKSFGRLNNYKIDPNQELIAIGVTNIFTPFFGGYPATGSFSRSAIKSKAGVRTPLAGWITAVVVIVAIYALTGGFYWSLNVS